MTNPAWASSFVGMRALANEAKTTVGMGSATMADQIQTLVFAPSVQTALTAVNAEPIWHQAAAMDPPANHPMSVSMVPVSASPIVKGANAVMMDAVAFAETVDSVMLNIASPLPEALSSNRVEQSKLVCCSTIESGKRSGESMLVRACLPVSQDNDAVLTDAAASVAQDVAMMKPALKGFASVAAMCA